MRLHPVGAADDQNGVVQHLKRALHFGREIHMAGSVHQDEPLLPQRQNRLLGKDRNAPLPLQRIRVQKGIPVIHPAHLFNCAAAVEHPLGEGGLARIHMGQYASDQIFHAVSPVL